MSRIEQTKLGCLQVAMMLLNTLEVNSDELLSHLCQECKLLDWIIDAPTSFTPLPCPSLSRYPSPP